MWKRHHFAWEYKVQRADPDAAFGQLPLYALALKTNLVLVGAVLFSAVLLFQVVTLPGVSYRERNEASHV